MLRNRTAISFAGAVSAVLAVATIIYGMMTRGFMGEVFETPMVITLAVCVVLWVVEMMTKAHWMPLVVTLAHAGALGLAVYYGAPTLSDYFNNIDFMGGDLTSVVNYILLTGVALLIRLVINFLPLRREEKQAV